MQFFRTAFIVAISLVAACSDTPSATDTVSKNLMWVVSPIQDDNQGFLETLKICQCAAKKAEAEWSAEEFKKFSAELQIHATAVKQTVQGIKRITIEGIEAGLLPERSDALKTQLNDFYPFIELCEQKIGVRGVEL